MGERRLCNHIDGLQINNLVNKCLPQGWALMLGLEKAADLALFDFRNTDTSREAGNWLAKCYLHAVTWDPGCKAPQNRELLVSH